MCTTVLPQIKGSARHRWLVLSPDARPSSACRLWSLPRVLAPGGRGRSGRILWSVVPSSWNGQVCGGGGDGDGGRACVCVVVMVPWGCVMTVVAMVAVWWLVSSASWLAPWLWPWLWSWLCGRTGDTMDRVVVVGLLSFPLRSCGPAENRQASSDACSSRRAASTQRRAEA